MQNLPAYSSIFRRFNDKPYCDFLSFIYELVPLCLIIQRYHSCVFSAVCLPRHYWNVEPWQLAFIKICSSFSSLQQSAEASLSKILSRFTSTRDYFFKGSITLVVPVAFVWCSHTWLPKVWSGFPRAHISSFSPVLINLSSVRFPHLDCCH